MLRWQRIHLKFWKPLFNSWVGRIPWRRDRLPIPVFLDFPCGSAGKESTCNSGDLGSVPGLGSPWVLFPGEGKCYLLIFRPREFCRLNSPWGHKESDTLSNFHFHILSATPHLVPNPLTN